MKYYHNKHFWNHIEDFLACILLIGMFVLLFLQVMMRFVFKFSIPVLEEYSLYMFVWFILLCASNAFLRNEHIRVEFIINLLPKKGQTVHNILVSVLNILFCIVLINVGWQIMYKRFMLNALSTTYFPLFVLFLATPVCMGLTTIRECQNIYYLIKYEIMGREVPPGTTEPVKEVGE